MKNRTTAHLFATFALSCLPSVVCADDSGVRKALQANYDRISVAFHDHKPDVMDALLAPDVTLTTPDHQTWSRERIVSDFKRQSSMMQNATWSRTVTKVNMHGNEAVATVKGKFHGTFGKPGATHVFDLDSLTVDTWVRAGKEWKLKHAETTQLKPKIDGKEPSADTRGHAG